jgi:L-asparaginase
MIRVLVTGGTFDKEYNEIGGTLFFKETHVLEMLRLGRCRAPVTVETLMLVDSLNMTDDDRERIAARCLSCPESRIVITHGTDTMVETARALAHALEATRTDQRQLPGTGQRQTSGTDQRQSLGTVSKTVVLTGAMVPYAFGSSDGLFNLGSAISFVQVLPPGVYIAMNGTHFTWNNVKKNRESGTFEPVHEP